MSLQEIEQSTIRSSQEGMKREIDDASQKMMLDVLQVSQYTKPIESTVRELTSNAVDSQKEKEIAIEILEGRADVGDYYIERDEDKYKASNWNPEYFDLNHLDKENNEVIIKYIEGKGSGYCDKLIIRDHGVGLGMPRLEGYFSLGYSTKRNSKSMLGAFGLGAKAALSTRCDYYTLNTVHNGKKFSFNCYSHKIDSLTPRFNESGEENPHIIMGQVDDPDKQITQDEKKELRELRVINEGDERELTESEDQRLKELAEKEGPRGYKVYYEETDEKNYSEVITPFKRHNRNRLVRAVKNQLLYFRNVKFLYVSEEGFEREIDFQAEILHNSPSLLISDTNQFSRPHIIIVKDDQQKTGVCYGAVDFKELEMQQLRGSVGFKTPIRSVVKDPETGERTVVQEGVTVTPSRESVIWDEHTRSYIEDVIDNAKEEAANLIQEELDEDNFFKWAKKCSEVISKAGSTWGRKTALSVLTRLIDKSDIKPVFPGDKSIKYEPSPSKFFWGLNPRVIRRGRGSYNSDLGDYEVKVKREDMSTWRAFNPNKIYILRDDERHSKVKDRYLLELHNGEYMVFKKDDDEKIEEVLREARENSQKDSKLSEAKQKSKFEKAVENKCEYRDKIYDLIINDEEYEIAYYSDVEVPDDFEEKIEEEKVQTTLSPKEKRKLQNRTVAYTYKEKYASYGSTEFRLEKKEPKLQFLNDVKNTVYYLTQKDDELMEMCALFNREKAAAEQGHSKPDFFRAQDAKNEDYDIPLFLRFSKRNRKHVRDNPKFQKIRKYLYNDNEEENMKALGDYFVPFFTARKIEDRLESVPFFNNFDMFNEELYKVHSFLKDYVKENYKNVVHGDLTSNHRFKEFTEYAEKLIEFQMFARDEDDEAKISQKADELFDDPDVRQTYAVDPDILRMMDELDDYAENVHELFNGIDYLTGKTVDYDRKQAAKTIPANAERLISELLVVEGLDRYELSEETKNYFKNLNNQNQQVTTDND